MSQITQKYPDTKEGAIAALLDMSVFQQHEIVGAIPDPWVEGVWKVLFNLPDTTAAIVCLAGYRDLFGNIRQTNDFESD